MGRSDRPGEWAHLLRQHEAAHDLLAAAHPRRGRQQQRQQLPLLPSEPAMEPSDKEVVATVEEALRLAAEAAQPNAEAAAASTALEVMWNRMATLEERREQADATPTPLTAAEAPLAPPLEGATREQVRAYRAAIRKAAVANIRTEVAQIDAITKDTKGRHSSSG